MGLATTSPLAQTLRAPCDRDQASNQVRRHRESRGMQVQVDQIP
jgi:hypothetical protein